MEKLNENKDLQQQKKEIASYYRPFSWSTPDNIVLSNPNLVFGKIKRIASHLSPAETKEILEFVRTLEDYTYQKYKKHIFTDRHSVWKLADYSAEVEKAQEERNNREDIKLELSECDVELSFSDDRLRILFYKIPASETRNELKRNGFHWSPTNSAWQRQLTDKAVITITHETYNALSFLNAEDKKTIRNAYKGVSNDDTEVKRKRALALSLKMKMVKANV